MADYVPMHTIIPEGSQGVAQIEHKVLGEPSLRMAFRPSEYVPKGTYTMLHVNGKLMMSDTPAEQSSNRWITRNARGDVLIAGLGIGMILVPILTKEEVQSVTVIERSKDVIDLVMPNLAKVPGYEKLTVINEDIFNWKPSNGSKWNTIYFDIWPTITTDNLPEMRSLHRKYGRRKTQDGVMTSWQYDYLKSYALRKARASRYY